MKNKVHSTQRLSLSLWMTFFVIQLGCDDDPASRQDNAEDMGGSVSTGGAGDDRAGGSEGGIEIGGRTGGMIEEGGEVVSGATGGREEGGAEVEAGATVETPLRWIHLDQGWEHGCGIDERGHVACWGRGDEGQLDGPQPEEGARWSRVSVGRAHSCVEGVHERPMEGGEVELETILRCWGRDDVGQLEIPNEDLHHITAGWRETCALDQEGYIRCWGELDPTLPPPSEQSFSQIQLGQGFGCGLTDPDARLVCWGHNEYGQASPPSGEGFSSLSVGRGHHACAIDAEGRARCWGDSAEGRTLAPAVVILGLSVGKDHSCALREDHGVVCWGQDRYDQLSAPEGQFEWLSAGPTFTCGLRSEGALSCWGRLKAPAAPLFTEVSVGTAHSCGIKVDQSLSCWGWDRAGRSSPPEGTYSHVAVGMEHSCAVSTEGSISCWGVGVDPTRFERDGDFDQSSPPERLMSLRALHLEVGDHHSCVITDEDLIDCWGDDREGQASPPLTSEGWQQLALGRAHSCALSAQGFLRCWGNNGFGQLDVPQTEQFTSVVAGGDLTCALTGAGLVQCWGDQGALVLSTQQVDDLALGRGTLCTYTRDTADVSCQQFLDSSAPLLISVGEVTQLSAGWGESCVLRRDQRVSCIGHHSPSATPEFVMSDGNE